MPLIDLLVQEMDAVIRQHLGHFKVFAANAVQLEDWFRGELLVALQGLQGVPAPRSIVGYGSPLVISVHGADKEADVEVKDSKEHIAIELKAWFIGTQRRRTVQTNTPVGYLDPDQMGGDVEKLAQWRGIGTGGYVIGFAYPRPTQSEWEKAVAALPSKFQAPRFLGAAFTDLTNYAASSPECLIGVLQVR